MTAFKTFVFLAVYQSIWTSLYNTDIKVQFFYKPYLNGEGSIYEIRNCLATATDRNMPFHKFFLLSLMHLLIPSWRKSDHRSRGHVTFCTRTSAQICPKSAFCNFTCRSTPLWASTLGHGFWALPCSSRMSGTISYSWLTSLNMGSSGRCLSANSRWQVYRGSVFLSTAWP